MKRPIQNDRFKICLVTPELIGPTKNGGIGTATTHLVTLLASEPRFQVSLLFAGLEIPASDKSWRIYYNELGIEILELKSAAPDDIMIVGEENPFLKLSRQVSETLRTHDFDLIHFQDWKANGFYTLRMRRTGRAFQSTQVAVTLHSPTAWAREGMEIPPEDCRSENRLEYAERYCVENADALIHPSQHILKWILDKGWPPPARVAHLPYAFTPRTHALDDPATEINFQHLIFFGRLESRKGLELFLQAIQRLHHTGRLNNLKRITFLGRIGKIFSGCPLTAIKRFANAIHPIIVETKTDLDTHTALRFIQESRGLPVMPSRMDNLPLAVIECIHHRIPFIAARTGGIPEIAAKEYLFEPTVEGMAEAIANRDQLPLSPPHRFDPQSTNQAWIDWHRNVRRTPAQRHRCSKAGRLSVCVPYFNQPAALQIALESLASQSFPSFEVVVCDDGSTQDGARKKFAELAEIYKPRGWHFITQENCGVGSARNATAKTATGDTLVFMDADNIAKPDMLALMVDSFEHSGVDALTVWYDAFRDETGNQLFDGSIAYRYQPLGPVFPLGLLENTFGDTHSIMKRSVFQEVGGFRERPLSALADWDFFLRLHLAGFSLDVLPESVFFYRYSKLSMQRTSPIYPEHRLILEAASELLSPDQQKLLRDFTLYQHTELALIYETLHKNNISIPRLRKTPWHKHVYRWYRRLCGDPRYPKN